MKNILKMIVVLSVLCACSGFVLSFLKTVTAPAIEEQVLNNVQGPAIVSVLAGAENNPISDRHSFVLPDGGKIMAFPSLRGGRLVGVALENFGKGYGGPVGVMVGFNTEGDTLAGVGMTSLKETPGLGMRVKEPGFSAQFRGAALPVELSAKGGTIDAVSGATISSTGVVEAVNRAADIYRQMKPEFVQYWQK